jgi:hypothetical protein
MRTRLMTASFALAAAVTLNAQTPQTPVPQPQPQNPPSSPASRPAEGQQPVTDTQRQTTQAANSQTVTITGCLKEEKDVAGEKANPAERAGVMADYILTDVKMAASSTVSGIALGTRYQIKGAGETELKKHLNHQVEVTGTIQQQTPTGTTGNATPDFNAISVKMLSATCPAVK